MVNCRKLPPSALPTQTFKLPPSGNADFNPGFAADDAFVYFPHCSEGKVHLFKVPFAGGQPVQVSDLQIAMQSISHPGDRILVQYFDDRTSQWKVGILSAADGKLLRPVDVSLA